ncbi:ArnT family glycosyltransferase [Pseudoxanthomonas beigongshangi]
MRAADSTGQTDNFYALLLVVIGGALISLFYFTGLFGSDDLAYINGAAGFGQAPYYALLGAARYTISVPLRVMLELSGNEPQRAAFGFVVVFIALALAVYFLAGKIYDKRVALLSSVLVVVNPVLFFFAGAVLPDNMLSILFVAAVLLFACWYQCVRSNPSSGGWSLFLASTFAALCYVTKEAALAFFLPVAVYALWTIRKLPLPLAARHLGWGLGGTVCVLLGDLLLSYGIFGDPLIRFTVAKNMNVVEEAAKFMSYQGSTPVERFHYAYGQFKALWPAVPIYLASILFLVWQHRSVSRFVCSVDGIVSLSAVWVMLFLTFGTISLHEYVGIPIQVRYYAPAAVLFCVVLARAVSPWLASTTIWRAAAMVLLTALMIYQVTFPAERAGDIYRAREFRAFQAAVSNAQERFPGVPVYAGDYFSFRALGYGPHHGVSPVKGNLHGGSEAIIIYNPAEAAKHADAWPLRCLSTADAGVTDITSEVAPRMARTRMDGVEAELGFFDWSMTETKPRVLVIMVERDGRCRSD